MSPGCSASTSSMRRSTAPTSARTSMSTSMTLGSSEKSLPAARLPEKYECTVSDGTTGSIERYGRQSAMTPDDSCTRTWNDSSTDSSVGGQTCANCGFISKLRSLKSTPTSSLHDVESSASRLVTSVRESESSMSVSSRRRCAVAPTPPSRRSMAVKTSGRSNAQMAFVPSGSTSTMAVRAGTGSDEMNSPYVTCSAPSTVMSATQRSAPERYVPPSRANVSCSISSVCSWSRLNFDGLRKSMFWTRRVRSPCSPMSAAGSAATDASRASISAWLSVSCPAI